MHNPAKEFISTGPKNPSRWSTVDPQYRQKLENLVPSEPFATAHSEHRDYNSMKTPAYYSMANKLPPLQYENIMKRASVQFTGMGNTIVFYNQLLNSLQPYGLFLRKVVDIKVDQTLCPDAWDGITISNQR